MKQRSYAEEVAAFVRSYRKSHGLTLDAIALAGREFGASWSGSSIQAIEGGKSALTLPTLLHLALALGHLSGKPLRIIDLLGPAVAVDQQTASGGGQQVIRSWVERALCGETVELTAADYQHARRASAAVGARRDPGTAAASLAESRAARKLGLTSHELQQQAILLWGRSLEEEALDRAGLDRTQQARGRVTRILVAEIQRAIADQN